MTNTCIPTIKAITSKKQQLKPHAKKQKRECGFRRWSPEITSNKTNNKVYTKDHANFIRILKAVSRTFQHRSYPNGNIINLSKHSFTKGQHDLLNKEFNILPYIWTLY